MRGTEGGFGSRGPTAAGKLAPTHDHVSEAEGNLPSGESSDATLGEEALPAARAKQSQS